MFSFIEVIMNETYEKMEKGGVENVPLNINNTPEGICNEMFECSAQCRQQQFVYAGSRQKVWRTFICVFFDFDKFGDHDNGHFFSRSIPTQAIHNLLEKKLFLFFY